MKTAEPHTPSIGRARDALVVVDGRNGLDAAAWRAEGWAYYGMGRP